MRETQKKILGYSGLAFVVGMTFVAANIQVPGALAAGASEVLTVRVVGADSRVAFTNPTGSKTVTDPSEFRRLEFTYEQVSRVQLVYSYRNPQGEVVIENFSLADIDHDYGGNSGSDHGDATTDIDLNTLGYGTYTYTLQGWGLEDGDPVVSDSIEIHYVFEEPGDKGDSEEYDGEFSNAYIDLDIGNYTNTEDDAAYYRVDVTNPDGTVVYTISVAPNKSSFRLPLYGVVSSLGDNNYHVIVTPVDENDDDLTPSAPIEVTPNLVADPSAPVVHSNGAITANFGIDPEQVDQVAIRIVDPENPNLDYTVTIPVGGEVAEDGTVEARLVNNASGATSTIRVLAPTSDGHVTIPFGEIDGIREGANYQLTITTSYGGDTLYTSVLTFTYPVFSVPNAGVPDTGGLLRELNISNEDYLISGLLFFFVLSVVAIGIVAKKRRAPAKILRRRD